MDFAKSVLLKYGWKEGQGIGKNADGITVPVKANLKFDNAGLSYDRAVEFKNHWWERAFNSAADNLNVDNSIGNVEMSIKDEESTEISASAYCTKQLKNKKGNKNYNGYFEKSKTMHNMDGTQCKSDSDSDTDEDISDSPRVKKELNDEELLKACGGRTAHKGARHGLNLLGKLSRIEAQEQQMLEKMGLTNGTRNIFQDWIEVKKKRKNRDKVKKNEDDTQSNIVEGDSLKTDESLNLVDQGDYQIKPKSKKKKKQHKNRDEDLANSLNNLSTSNDVGSKSDHIYGIQQSSKKIKKVKRKKKHRETLAQEIDEQVISSEPIREKKKKGKKKRDKKEKQMEIDAEQTSTADHKLDSKLRKKMKSKKKDKKKALKERVEFYKISKRIQLSMCLSD